MERPPIQGQNLVLVGASVRAAAESAGRAGYRVIGIDHFGDNDTRAACDQYFQIPNSDKVAGSDLCSRSLEQILPSCTNQPMLVVGGINGGEPLVRELLRVGRPIGAPAAVMDSLANPSVWIETAGKIVARCDAQLPPSYLTAPSKLESITEAPARWLRKQPHQSGGFGVKWHRLGESLNNDHYLSRWIAGRNYGVTFASDGTIAHRLGTCRSLRTKKFGLPFVYAGSLGPIRLPVKTTHRLDRLGQAIVDQLGISGLFNVDVVIDSSNQVWLLEINPRWSASAELIELARVHAGMSKKAASLIGLAVAPKGVHQRPISEPELACYLKRVIYARRSFRFQSDVCRDRLTTGQSVHDVPVEGTRITRGAPAVTLITTVEPNSRRWLNEYRIVRRALEIGT